MRVASIAVHVALILIGIPFAHAEDVPPDVQAAIRARAS